MIGYLKGVLLEHQDGKCLVGIGESASVVGYLVNVPQNVATLGGPIELFVYTHVREDSLDLYGFPSQFEKTLFIMLLSVSGIGPKSALTILSAAPAQDLVEAIASGEQERLTRIPGIGKKTAERVVLELKDAIRKKLEAGGGLSGGLRAVPSNKALGGGFVREGASQVVADAKEALIGLGYKDFEVDSLVRRVVEAGKVPTSAEDLVKNVLRQLV